MTLQSDSERAEAKRLIQRAAKCAILCDAMSRVDTRPSICAAENKSLSDITVLLQVMVDTGKMRNTTCFRLLDLILDLQEACVSDRKAELGI